MILLFGAGGQLGRELAGLASARAVPLRGVSRVEGDVTDRQAVADAIAAAKPTVVVNAAAYTAVDKAEQEEALAMRVNADAVGALGGWAATHGALLIHYSTDYVFDGQADRPYPVDAPVAPLGAYGRSKLAGERALRASGAEHLIFRTAWVYAAHGHNFLRTMLRLGAERDELRVVADQQGTPTSTALIVRASLAALDHWQRADPAGRRALAGTHHLVASGMTSWHGFADAIFEQAVARGLLSRRPHVIPIATADFPTPARRPAWSVLDNTGFQQRFGFNLPHWHDGLHEIIDQLSHDAA